MAMHVASSIRGGGRGAIGDIEDWRSRTSIEDRGGVEDQIEQKPMGEKKGRRKKERRKERKSRHTREPIGSSAR
jgi:hypothetical protein